MRIVGMGIDIVDVDRIESALGRFGDRFLTRVFCDAEIFYCQSMKNPAVHLAARFAAKEAVSKAFGTGIGAEMGWKDIEVLRSAHGEPAIAMHGAGKATAAARGVSMIYVSLSHTEVYAAANALVVSD
jgi:holo-[acyl-carrier protein] synthase